MHDPESFVLPHRAINKSLDHIGLSEAEEGLWKGDFCFIQAADTQLGLIDDFDSSDTGTKSRDDLTWDEELRRIEILVSNVSMMEPKPLFMVVCGDMIHAYPGGVQRDAQERDFINAFRRLNREIPLLCVCGNHDVGDLPTVENVSTYRSVFGDDYFSFWVGGCHFIVLNSKYYKSPSSLQNYTMEMDRWLDTQLAIAPRAKHTIVFQHIPLFLSSPDEETTFFNIGNEGNLRKLLLDKLHDAGIKLVMAGHYHENALGWYKDLEMVVTTAVGCQLGNDKSGARVVKVREENIEHVYYNSECIPTDWNN